MMLKMPKSKLNNPKLRTVAEFYVKFKLCGKVWGSGLLEICQDKPEQISVPGCPDIAQVKG